MFVGGWYLLRRGKEEQARTPSESRQAIES
jgi:hypothetical protein